MGRSHASLRTARPHRVAPHGTTWHQGTLLLELPRRARRCATGMRHRVCCANATQRPFRLAHTTFSLSLSLSHTHTHTHTHTHKRNLLSTECHRRRRNKTKIEEESEKKENMEVEVYEEARYLLSICTSRSAPVRASPNTMHSGGRIKTRVVHHIHYHLYSYSNLVIRSTLVRIARSEPPRDEHRLGFWKFAMRSTGRTGRSAKQSAGPSPTRLGSISSHLEARALPRARLVRSPDAAVVLPSDSLIACVVRAA